MHTKLFGNRDKIITVKNLKINLENRVLRFPQDTILKIENLEVSRWSAPHFECLKSIIDPPSFPIQQLKMESSPRSPDFRHTIVKEANSLVIDNRKFGDASWTPILLNLNNRRGCLMNENRRDPPNNYMDLIEDWLERGRPVGTTFSMGLKNNDTAKQCLDTLRQREEVLGSSEKQKTVFLLNMIRYCDSTPDFRHSIVKEAKSLVIDNHSFGNASWTPILLNLTNRRVCLENENQRVPPNNYTDLIENWLERGRPVGTTFSMGLKNEDTAKQCLDTLKQRENVLGSSEKQVQLRINASLILNVSYEMIEQPGRLPRDYQSKWWLRLKVIRRRSE
ncbi:hypothetical protein CRE_13582 [Caenorhabditis remanei]|uniref:Uncharacterized protein n=1 Tax=Caenorhabditis remanei TaxID=31234 RepID=E3N1C7_CAERE|nr:hypothetical protein CRE_13582 [Caenorhabditis remanei]